ncbi:benzyl alcohol dehydrogenase [Alteribacillus persepolensis]|uniref:Benzyl alcohol dehydrogenase n=1 Tax=Alteribacillus persepolensis TaxID=568899 RepID=A0A1G8ATP4_9BACI|nr:NAD(P)-dependent alcohol dehydrogenase [Alteribacillus persepolensis]SDH24287.1 benzyl alcohol dehydrogenase [Alteribacillus persepolensis]
MITKAAVVTEKGGPFHVKEITIDEPKANEVLVKMVGSGICHTDLVVRDQHFPVDLPAVLGHEGSGIVEKVGEGVTNVTPGDHVVLTYSSCGECESCWDGKPYACEHFFELNFGGNMLDGTKRLNDQERELSHLFGQSSFSYYAVANANNMVKVPKDVPLEMLGPLGCGIQTGCGAVLNKLKPEPGSALAVFGCGSVGLSAIMAAKIAGCTPIIAVDIHEDRLQLAKELGATHTIQSNEQDPIEKIMEWTKKGVLYSLETSGVPHVLRQSVDCLAVSGTAAIIGAPPIGTEVSLDVKTLRSERNITGVVEGSGIPQVFIPKLIDLYKQGMLPFDKLLSYYSLEDINQACEDAENGKSIKPVIVFS